MGPGFKNFRGTHLSQIDGSTPPPGGVTYRSRDLSFRIFFYPIKNYSGSTHEYSERYRAVMLLSNFGDELGAGILPSTRTRSPDWSTLRAQIHIIAARM